MEFIKKNLLSFIILALISLLIVRLEMVNHAQKKIDSKVSLIHVSNKNISTQLAKSIKPPAPPKIDYNKFYDVEIGDSVVLGSKKAKVTIIKWTDFQCPYCSQSTQLVKQIMKKYPNDVQVVIKNFPLNFHKQARQAAIYALAAQKQGKYSDLYYAIFERYRELKTNPNLIFELCDTLGINKEKLKKEAAKPKYSQLIDKEMSQLRATGMRLSVPKFLINGKEPNGRDLNSWSAIIDAELKKSS